MSECSECGLIHPPTPPGQCPIAKGQQLDQQVNQLDSDKSVKLMQAIQTKLIEKSQKIPIDRFETLAMEVFKYIDSFK